jgi:aldehyde dehydrogenase (NAD+)
LQLLPREAPSRPTTRRQRLGLLRRIVKGFEARNSELAHAMSMERGSPITFSNEVQTVNALTHFKEMISVLKAYKFERNVLCRHPKPR